MNDRVMVSPFAVKDCALIAIATGKRAQNLRELTERLREVEANSVFYHFWGGLLRPRFDNPEYHNDFAIWVAESLHNKVLAEKLAAIDPSAFENIEDLRNEVIETLEETLDDAEYPLWAKKDSLFDFIRCRLVIFDTKLKVPVPENLLTLLPNLSLGSIFFHFIDGRRRNKNSLDDFCNWITGFGAPYEELVRRIGEICPYFTPLNKLRDQLTEVLTLYFEGKKP
ncbi:MAG: DUF5752 family protein [Desulfobacterota bacterium]|jgi:hypothetical protein|nr:DUF5752 family protein [Thermodesulfobacteriota bacterium]